MTAKPVVVVVRYLAQPGKAEAARLELSKLIAAVQANESACLGITLHQGRETPEGFLLIERWTDIDTFTGPHMKTEHLQAFIAGASSFLAGPPEISFWDAEDA